MSLVFLGRGADNAALDVINEPLAAHGGERLGLRRWKHREPPFSLSDTRRCAHRGDKRGWHAERKKPKSRHRLRSESVGWRSGLWEVLCWEYSPGPEVKDLGKKLCVYSVTLFIFVINVCLYGVLLQFSGVFLFSFFFNFFPSLFI